MTLLTHVEGLGVATADAPAGRLGAFEPANVHTGSVEDYWRSPAAMERKRIARSLEAVRAIFNDEPTRKGRAGKRQAVPFRDAVREELVHRPQWPRPRAALAVDLHFHSAAAQPPALWHLPKHYLDLLGETSAPSDDPGPVLYRNDAQVKLLFASLSARGEQDRTGTVYLEARTRTSAVADMELAGELADDPDEFEDHTRWAEAVDPSETPDWETERASLPADLAQWLRLHDKSLYQAALLGGNDRLLRDVFFRNPRWLLTGTDPHAARLDRLELREDSGVEQLVNRIAHANAHERQLLWSTIRIVLPSLPVRHGQGARWRHDVRQAFRKFTADRPDLQPLLVPLRVTLLVIPPGPPPPRPGRKYPQVAKDLDNILIDVLSILEDELEPHAEPWLRLPEVKVEGVEPDSERAKRRVARLRASTGSHTWAYQVIELHRMPNDTPEGSLLVVPGLGWNHKSLWEEAEDFVEKRLPDLAAD